MKNGTITQKPEIQSVAIYKVTVKATGQQCFAVPSDSQPGVYYITCWNAVESRWTCTCKAGEHGRSCKHARAAQVSILANKAEADRRHEQEAQMADLAQEMAAISEAAPTDTRYYPSYRAAGQWNRFSERGKDVSFATERDARSYLTGVAGECRVEVVERERPISERGQLNGSREFSLLRK